MARDSHGYAAVMIALGLPEPECDHRFHPTRKWEIDLAWPLYKVGVEIQGGIVTGKRCPTCKQPFRRGHTSVSGHRRDMEKLNAAQLLGWVLLQYEPTSLLKAASDIKDAINGRTTKVSLPCETHEGATQLEVE